MTTAPLAILMVGSLPLTAPWNGADKMLARTIILADTANHYIVQSGPDDVWPDHVDVVRESGPASMPGLRSQLRAAAFLLRHSRRAEVIHVVASLRRPSRVAIRLLRWWALIVGRPLVHSMPAMAANAIERTGAIGQVTVAFSHHTADRLSSLGVPHVVELFPPVEIAEAPSVERGEAIRRRLRLGPSPILYAAHLDRNSGMREAILALARLPPSLAEANLVLAIRWRAGQDVRAAVRALDSVADRAGVAGRLRWVRDVDDMPALIAACRLTALVPKELDGKMDLPLVLLESLALDRPIVVTDAPPLNEALLDGGVAVPFGDIDGLAAAFTMLLEQSDLSHRLAAAGRRRVRSLADPARAADAYRQLYRRVVDGAETTCA